MNNEEDQSLADGWWDPPLWHGWYSSFHCVFMSTGDKSDQMGRRDESSGGGRERICLPSNLMILLTPTAIAGLGFIPPFVCVSVCFSA